MKKTIAKLIFVVALSFVPATRAAEKTVQQWEYAFLVTSIHSDKNYSWVSPEGRVDYTDFAPLLALLNVKVVNKNSRADFDAIGQCGWELVSADTFQPGATQYIFKRPRRPQGP